MALGHTAPARGRSPSWRRWCGRRARARRSTWSSEIGPTVGTHAGPGAYAVAFVHDPLDDDARWTSPLRTRPGGRAAVGGGGQAARHAARSPRPSPSTACRRAAAPAGRRGRVVVDRGGPGRAGADRADGARGGARRRWALGLVFAASLARLRLRGARRARCGCFGARPRAPDGAAGRPGARAWRRSAGLVASGAADRPCRRPRGDARGRRRAGGPRGSSSRSWSCSSWRSTARWGCSRPASARPPRSSWPTRGPPLGATAPALAGLDAQRPRAGGLRARPAAGCAPSCEPALRALERDGLRVHAVAEDEQPDVFRRYRVPGTPYVAYLEDGVVAAKGLVNTLEQIEELDRDRTRARACRGLSGRSSAARGRCRGGWRRAPRGARSWPAVGAAVLGPLGLRAAARGRGRAASAAPTASAAAGTASAATTSPPARAPAPTSCRASTRAASRCGPPTGGRSTTSAALIDALGRPVDRRGRAAARPRRQPAAARPAHPHVRGLGARALRRRRGHPGRLVPLLRRPDPQAHRLLLHQPHAHQRRRRRCAATAGPGRRVFCVMYYDTGVPC